MAATKPRQPQDHKPKASAGFTFDHDGRTYSLPAPSQALGNLDGRALRDAMLGGQMGELQLAFRCLEAVGAEQEAVDAIYAKPVAETATIILEWLRSADLSGATLPQS